MARLHLFAVALPWLCVACAGSDATSATDGAGASSTATTSTEHGSGSTTSSGTTQPATSSTAGSTTATTSGSGGSGGGAASTGAGGAPPCGAEGQACCISNPCNPGLVCDGAACASALEPFTCPGGSNGPVFVRESAPPSTLTPWQHVATSVTFANCTATTWTAATDESAPTGVKLGAAAPHDLPTWTPTRVVLGADVPPGQAITVAIDVHAPALTGPHDYAFELVDEGVAWLGSPSPTHAVDVEAVPGGVVSLCAGQTADPSGTNDASAAIQACLDATPASGSLVLPPGIFRVSEVVHVDRAMTITSAGALGVPASCLDYDAPRCAVLRADATTLPSSAGTRGFVRLGSLATAVSGVTIDHVLVDGNRGARLGSTAAANCAAGDNGDGINVGANCASCTLTGFVSARAVCGSGLEWDGDGITVKGSVFFGNGDHDTQNMWSDGLTIHKSDGAVVSGCQFVDDSDVGFISGGGTNAQYTGNVAMQLSQSSFAAIMLDNFDNAALGNFTGATLVNNTVVCEVPCHFGIELGPHPWYQSPNIIGGSVTGNAVSGADIEINAQGAGTAASPTVIANNTLGPTPASADFSCGAVSGLSPLNVSAESHVDLQGGAATGSISVPCP